MGPDPVTGNDYVPKSLTAQTIPAGNTTFAFDVTVNGDPSIEADETFLVNVTNVSGAALGDGQAKGTIQMMTVRRSASTAVAVTEGDSGTTPTTFTVTLSPPGTQTVTGRVRNLFCQPGHGDGWDRLLSHQRYFDF